MSINGDEKIMYFYVGIAGAMGAIARYVIGLVFFSQSVFPFATLCVNLMGCFALAFITSRSMFSERLKVAVGTGFLGSFTTFSAFSVETVHLFHNGTTILAFTYIGVSMVGGILMSNLGWKK